MDQITVYKNDDGVIAVLQPPGGMTAAAAADQSALDAITVVFT